jgi:hypothetical protein
VAVEYETSTNASSSLFPGRGVRKRISTGTPPRDRARRNRPPHVHAPAAGAALAARDPAAQPAAQRGGQIVERLDLVRLHLAKRPDAQRAAPRQLARALVAPALRILARLLTRSALLIRPAAARTFAAAAAALALARHRRPAARAPRRAASRSNGRRRHRTWRARRDP